MDKEDYAKYYIQGSDHYLLPKDVFIELFDEMNNWKEESKKKDEVIEDAIQFMKDNCIEQIPDLPKGCYRDIASIGDMEQLLQILEDKETDINVGEV